MTSTSQPTTGADPLARLHAPETQQRAVELLQRWMDERDTRFTVEDFVSVCTESDMEELAHDVMDQLANEGVTVDDTTYCALTGVVEQWQEGGYVCAICERLTARTVELDHWRVVCAGECQEALEANLEHGTQSMTLTMHRVTTGDHDYGRAEEARALADAHATEAALTDGRSLTPLDMLKLGQARRTIARLDSPVRTR
jgi:hypothetical protein